MNNEVTLSYAAQCNSAGVGRAAGTREDRGTSMASVQRLLRWFTLLAVSAVLAACGGGGPATVQNPVVPVTAGADYNGPAPSSADVQAFKINFWENVRSTNRCGQCHNASSPGQLPNFARSDDVNLAYTQANKVVNLTEPGQSTLVLKVGGGHNCWLSDPNACASILTQWITNWAGSSAGSGTQIQLQAPAIKEVGGSKNFPDSSSLFAADVYTPYLSKYCSKCHSPTAAVPQSPFFASSVVDDAYAAAQPKMNLDDPALSRFVVRLRDESHNCWTDCATAAAAMKAGITALANGVPITKVDPTLVISKALTMYDGTVASGGSRFDSNAIAKYEFKTGKGATAFDTSGVDPAADLTLSGSGGCTAAGGGWVGGWGISFGPAGCTKAQASTATSKKLHDMILATGEFSIEAWVAPANVTQEDAYMVSYSGGMSARNFTMGQAQYDYTMMLRSSGTDGNGMPAMMTADAAKVLQASLQHVVITYDPVNGRRVYVNGAFTGDMDAQKGATINNWDDTFALVLGNEVSSNRTWTGVIKFVAIHNRVLTDAQIKQNFAAGVGERYFLLFNVEAVTGVAKGYVMFEVSQYDSYAYLFNKPVFISLDPSAKPDNIVVKGIRIGINGVVPTVGQAYIPLNTMITASNYFAGQGEKLSEIGTVIALQKGPTLDTFFLSFDQLGSKTHVVTEAVPLAPAVADLPTSSKLGVRTFDRINATFAAVTGVPKTNANVSSTYKTVQQQLPTSPTFEGFLASHQVGIAQLAIQYCNEMVNNASLSAAMFPSVNLSNNSLFSSQGGIDSVVNPLVDKALGTGLATQDTTGTRTELGTLIGKLTANCSGGTCPAGRVKTVTAATCAAVLGSAGVLVN